MEKVLEIYRDPRRIGRIARLRMVRTGVRREGGRLVERWRVLSVELFAGP